MRVQRLVGLCIGLTMGLGIIVPLAHADCADWEPSAAVVVHDPPARLWSGGSLWGVSFEYSVKSPLSFYGSLRVSLHNIGARVEIVDERGDHVDLGPKSSWEYRFGVFDHPMEWDTILEPGRRGTVGVPARWILLPRGGRYWFRVGFRFPDVADKMPRPGEAPELSPFCEAWSDWTLIDFHPILHAGFIVIRPGAAPVLYHGALVRDDRGFVKWLYWDGAMRTVTLGRTAKRKKKKDLRHPGYRDTDVVVDADGVAHIVYPAGGDKTVYVRVGDKGAVLSRSEVAGKKVLARSEKKVVLVDKPLPPASPTK